MKCKLQLAVLEANRELDRTGDIPAALRRMRVIHKAMAGHLGLAQQRHDLMTPMGQMETYLLEPRFAPEFD